MLNDATLSADGLSPSWRLTNGMGDSLLGYDWADAGIYGVGGGSYKYNVVYDAPIGLTQWTFEMRDNLVPQQIASTAVEVSVARTIAPQNPAVPVPPPVNAETITRPVGWVPTYRIPVYNAQNQATTLDACTLTLTTLAGSIAYGPAQGVRGADHLGYHVMTWPDAAYAASGVYLFSFNPTVDGGAAAPFTGQVILSGQSAPVNPFPAISLEGIKAKLVGLDSWLAAAARQAVPYDDQRIVNNIPAVLRKFERETTVQIRPVQVITRDDGTYTKTVNGVTTASNGLVIKKEDAYTYYPDTAFSYFITNLKTRPVQSIQRCRILFGNTTILEIPSEWYEVDVTSGSFQILPVQGSLLFAEYSSSFALLQAGFSNRSFIPHVVHFDYVAGLLPGWEQDDEYADLLRVLEEYCALAVLNDISHLADAGLSGKSISGGGAGESYNYTRFADRKAELKASIQEFSDVWKGQESPYLMGGL